MGAGTSTIQQVQCVNFEKILNMWFLFPNPDNIMKAIKYPYRRQPERALPVRVRALGFSEVSFCRRARPGAHPALSRALPRSCSCTAAPGQPVPPAMQLPWCVGLSKSEEHVSLWGLNVLAHKDTHRNSVAQGMTVS